MKLVEKNGIGLMQIFISIYIFGTEYIWVTIFINCPVQVLVKSFGVKRIRQVHINIVIHLLY